MSVAACSPADTQPSGGATAATVAATSSNIPRGPDGKPDLNGIWQVLSTANNNLEAAPAKAAFAMVPGDFVPVPAPEVVALGAVGAVPASFGVVEGGTIPYKPEALAQRQANQDNWLTADPEIKCYMPGVPRATYMPHPFQIFHSNSAVFFAYSFAGAVRNIYLEDPGEPPLDAWMGQSYGYWDGDTFVIEVTGLDDRTWFDRSGNYHTYKLKVTERYTLVSENVMEYEATIEDADIFERPWTISMPIYRRLEEGFELPQFKCVEFVEELMYGRYRKGREAELFGTDIDG
ncbi:MAG: hypothetical protein Q8L60_00430 [Gammaproteobacteria bacterium]|nr:hypothetical protein [Gammaproteobacteria bacterium]MDP2142329.1 hypothetical protein [Gammaproteobacteria bacterium]MDP2348570.1 hypothetical protein [Gammaproteobacteria bacterium]